MARVGNISKATKDAARIAAGRLYAEGSDDRIEVDEKAKVLNTGDRTGYWVAAWVYVEHSELKV